MGRTEASAVPRKRRVTSYDVAVAAGVAQSTVSRCFVPGSELSATTRARVQEVAATLGYVPNALARSLITRRSDMVALIVTAFTLRVNPAIVSGIGRALNAQGKQLLLMAVDSDEAARAAARAALHYPLDGLVLATSLSDADVRPFLKRGVPVLSFNRPMALPRVDRIATDQAGSAREIAGLLHAAGHRRFLCVGATPDTHVNRERAAGFQERLAELAVADARQTAADPSYDGGRQGFLAYVRAHGVPDAVFCVNDALAFGVLDACRFDLGLQAPRDVSVVGFDDLQAASHRSYDLTTVRQSIEAMAEAAVALLLQRLDQPEAKAQRRLFQGVVVLRGSARL